MLHTERLFLIPTSLPMLEAIADENWPVLSSLLGGVDIADQWTHFPEALVWMRDFAREHPADMTWWNYLIVHRHDVRLIGTCGFKGPPGPDGLVEIGYEIADAYQGRGFATEAARRLTEHALTHDAVIAITAHTLAEENASCTVLRKLGFAFAGEHVDIEDGKIWAWKRER
ncbi:MAG: GNAT family N-acetyltransferase [Saprospiraceae bacterium]|nr:GNAT family N-acetyltransferase [Saprospiraceae bacterium]